MKVKFCKASLYKKDQLILKRSERSSLTLHGITQFLNLPLFSHKTNVLCTIPEKGNIFIYLLLSAAGSGGLGGVFQRTLYFSSIMLWLREMR